MEPKINITPTQEALVIREGVAPEIFQYRGFSYHADTSESFAKLVKAKAPVEHCVVFCNDRGFHAVVDDTIVERKQDEIRYAFDLSIQAKEWMEILTKGKVFDVKGMVDFLKRREENEIADIDRLLYAVSNFKYVTNVQGDFSFDDRNNYTFNIKLSDGEGTVRIPRLIAAHIELLHGSKFVQDLEIEIEVQRPKDPSERPCFLLSCPKYPRYFQEAMEYQFARLPEMLPDYLIVSGNC